MRSVRAALAALLVVTATAACGGDRRGAASDEHARLPDEAPARADDLLAALPAEAVASDGGGGPRTRSYWAVWNTCAPDGRADEAAELGVTLLDDVLADPGVALGDRPVTTCEEAVALLSGRTAQGDVTDDPSIELAAELLAAELNLNVGAERCPAADEIVVGSQMVLSSSGFDGVASNALDDESRTALDQLVELLRRYNSGELCR